MSQIQVYIQKVNRAYLEQNFETVIKHLYPERKSRVLAFKRREPAYVSITAGWMLQTLIMQMYGIAPEQLVLEKNENGKPYLKEHPEFSFNLSHAGDYVVLAYGSQPLGIDIERIREKNLQVAARCFTEREYQYVLGKEPVEAEEGARQTARLFTDPVQVDSVEERFFKLWTMKEAYLKLTGQGISVPLRSFSVDPFRERVEGQPYCYDMYRLEDYWIAVCTLPESKIQYKILEKDLTLFSI